MEKSGLSTGLIVGIVAIVILVAIFLGPDSTSPPNSVPYESPPDSISALSCEAQYNDLIKDLDAANYCGTDNDCVSLPISAKKPFIDLDLSECWYSVNKQVRYDLLSTKLTSYMYQCKDEFYKYVDKCAPIPQALCSGGKCVPLLYDPRYLTEFNGTDCSTLQGDEQFNCCQNQIGSEKVWYNPQRNRCERVYAPPLD